jgi:hypothetical protein
LIRDWPDRKVFAGDFAALEQREFGDEAFWNAPTGITYRHFVDGQQIVFSVGKPPAQAQGGK